MNHVNNSRNLVFIVKKFFDLSVDILKKDAIMGINQ